MLRASLLVCSLLPIAGCYEHVVRTSGDPSTPRQTYDPNVDDSAPGFFDQLFWGDPPAGQDPVEYYRLKRAGKDIPPSRVPPSMPTPPAVEVPLRNESSANGTTP
ncbi:MAG: hypothetical protein FJ254_06835 [Phycisphaerae bacterium]|nr:hypothetical protein [Phycisphaerae bacterium]